MSLNKSISKMNINNEQMDLEDKLLNSDTESSSSGAGSMGSSASACLSIEVAREEMINILKEILDSQSTLCTKGDLKDYSQKI
ncbi:hypothetical protein Bhyg_02850 [Pseudolycoriella hygida]|uniref:Uncharacterized protein n=1 Tax=Pseudolycoriella hygida TaxID=35572 RepID=A0A9Q0NC68_9DIPT|nr:hypothetical protein Bhyg_02850 [Pseudolycoriella hygida]